MLLDFSFLIYIMHVILWQAKKDEEKKHSDEEKLKWHYAGA